MGVDKAWTNIMTEAKAQPNILEFCGSELLQTLPALKEQLAECQRKLSAHLAATPH